jgi:uncharacterized repeat protein (TIGR01451 family)
MPTKFFKSQLRIDCNERIVEIPFVLQNLVSTTGMTILDFGCAESVLPIYLATQGAQVLGVDLREYDFEHPNFRFCKGDFLNNDFSDAYFDAVVAVSSVEHVGLNVYGSRAYESGDNKVVREFRRVLKSGGVLILTVPFGKRYVDEELRVYDSQLITELTDGFVNTKRKFYRRAVEGTHWLGSSEEECSESGVHPVTGVAGVACLVCKKGDQSGKIDRPTLISDSKLLVEAGGCVIVKECGVITSDSSPTTLVPDVVGLLQASAKANIDAVNLTVGEGTAAHDPAIPVGNVMSQFPAGGTTVTANTSVDLQVSLGAVADLALTKSDLMNDVAVGDDINYKVGIAVVARSTTVGTITSDASATTTTNDPNPANNFATGVTNIVALPQPEADLVAAEVDSVDPVDAGDNISYTITVANSGPDTAEGVVVTDTIPEGLTFFSATPQAVCGEESGAVLCLLGDMSNGASVDIGLVFTTSTDGNVTNTASAVYNTVDPVSDNNSGIETTLIQSSRQSSRSTVRILLLGDSITRGTNTYPSYRHPLWIKLVGSGRDFDFVGSQNSIGDGNPVFPDYKGQSFDSDHEGHSGWRADEIVAGLPKWLESYTPDIVLLHIGTNDVFDDQSTQSTVNEIMQIIDVLRADNPSVKIL